MHANSEKVTCTGPNYREMYVRKTEARNPAYFFTLEKQSFYSKTTKKFAFCVDKFQNVTIIMCI